MSKEETKKEPDMIEVPSTVIADMQKQMAEMERKIADQEAKNAGLEEMVANSASTNEKLKEKKTFEPKFRTVRLRKYPIAGDENNMGYIIGWTKKGAYQEPVQTPIGAQLVDFIDVIFYGKESKAEKIKLLDMLNKGEQVVCKILEQQRKEIKKETGEEIGVNVFDPQHGLIATGDTVDGYVAHYEIKYKLQVPDLGEIWVDSEYVNA